MFKSGFRGSLVPQVVALSLAWKMSFFWISCCLGCYSPALQLRVRTSFSSMDIDAPRRMLSLFRTF